MIQLHVLSIYILKVHCVQGTGIHIMSLGRNINYCDLYCTQFMEVIYKQPGINRHDRGVSFLQTDSLEKRSARVCPFLCSSFQLFILML
jgi:hypothetical protein